MGEVPPVDSSWIIVAAERFEQAWKIGPPPRSEGYPAEVDEPGRAPLLGGLLRVEHALRGGGDEEPNPKEYHRRFPGHAAVIVAAFGGEMKPLPSTAVG